MISRKGTALLSAIAASVLAVSLVSPAYAETGAEAEPAAPENAVEQPEQLEDLGESGAEDPAVEEEAVEDQPAAAPEPEADGELSELLGGETAADGAQPPVGEAKSATGPNKRISGSNRFATAVAVSKHGYPNPATVTTVIVANGENFPDALSAGALGAKLKAPLLLTGAATLDASTKTELQRLNPTRVLVIGGKGAVSANAFNQIKSALPSMPTANLERISGKSRYDTSIAIAKRGWTTSGTVFVATGAGFADALSAGAAAGKLGVPVVLVPGSESKAPAATLQLLTQLNTTAIRVAGGNGAVSAGMENSLKAGSRSSIRYAGSSRYETSAKVVNAVFATYPTTYWASGSGFADALAGSAVAGAKGSPLLLTEKTCVPSAVYDANDKYRPATDTFLLGGKGALAQSVLNGNECMKVSGATTSELSQMNWLYGQINQARFDAGRPGVRLANENTWANVKIGAPAFAWSKKMRTSRNTSLNPNLGSQQPWVGTEIVTGFNTYGGQTHLRRTWDAVYGNSGYRSDLLQSFGTYRGAVNIGYVTQNEALYGLVGYGTFYIGLTQQA